MSEELPEEYRSDINKNQPKDPNPEKNGNEKSSQVVFILSQ